MATRRSGTVPRARARARRLAKSTSSWSSWGKPKDRSSRLARANVVGNLKGDRRLGSCGLMDRHAHCRLGNAFLATREARVAFPYQKQIRHDLPERSDLNPLGYEASQRRRIQRRTVRCVNEGRPYLRTVSFLLNAAASSKQAGARCDERAINQRLMVVLLFVIVKSYLPRCCAERRDIGAGCSRGNIRRHAGTNHQPLLAWPHAVSARRDPEGLEIQICP
ncbi:hypothetical protein X881_3659 [Burkholderia pseudomallei MSHR4300]|nr:hypothetical protein X881_3659 [Burkholderia pseudomallei MSHR4300]